MRTQVIALGYQNNWWQILTSDFMRNALVGGTLVALAFAINLCLLGKRGFARLAQINLAKGEYAKQQLTGVRGFQLAVSGPTFNEFALRVRGSATGAAGAVCKTS